MFHTRPSGAAIAVGGTLTVALLAIGVPIAFPSNATVGLGLIAIGLAIPVGLGIWYVVGHRYEESHREQQGGEGVFGSVVGQVHSGGIVILQIYEGIADDQGDELEHGEPDYPGQFPGDDDGDFSV